jgi:hypothetical protein
MFFNEKAMIFVVGFKENRYILRRGQGSSNFKTFSPKYSAMMALCLDCKKFVEFENLYIYVNINLH